MKHLWKFMTLYDKLLIISLIIISGIFIFEPLINILAGGNYRSTADKIIVIQTGDGLKQRITMSDTYREKPLIIKIEGPIGTSIIEAHKGRVRIKEAPPADPEKICEKIGWIDQPGLMIICVPNQISIWIETKESELDGVSW